MLGHLWSLAVEEQFYLIWPALLFLFARKRRAALRMILLLWSLSLAFRLAVVFLHLPRSWALLTIMGRSGELLAGSYLALLVRGTTQEREAVKSRAPYLFGLSFSICVALGVYIVRSGMSPERTDQIIGGVGLAILSIVSPCALLIAMDNTFVSKTLSVAPLQWIGKISYGLYVYHFLFRIQYYELATYLAPHLSATSHLLLVELIALVGTFVVATVSYYTLEIAFLRLKPILSGSKKERQQLAID
jgi:peptidoglycan/LPS O-acetylase OafA/YrhL